MLNKLSSLFKSAPKVNQKYFVGDCYSTSFVNYLFNRQLSNLGFYVAIDYYQKCAPLFSAVQLLADEISGITPYVYNTNDRTFTVKSPLLDLLENPNLDITGNEFLEQLACYFIITGNCFIVATGDSNRPAKELFIIPPQYVTLSPSKNGYADTMSISSEFFYSDTFKAREVNGRLRFYNETGAEIWHIKEYNPLMGYNHLYGMSKVMPIQHEIEQYIHSSRHNLSLLVRGARPSGALVAQTPLDQDQFMRLSEEIDRFYAGSNNAGRPILLENGIDFKEMSVTNKDMDFMELKKNVTNTIFNTLKIPLPLVSPDHMTMSNMDAARLTLYDNAVLPLVNRIFTELTNFLMHRYTNDKNLILWYSVEEISALEPRRNDELMKQKSLGVLTINEIRSKIGYEPLEGGDVLLGSLSETAIARDTYTLDEPKTPNPSSKEYVIKTLAKQRNIDGTPKYNSDQIKKIVEYYFDKES